MDFSEKERSLFQRAVQEIMGSEIQLGPTQLELKQKYHRLKKFISDHGVQEFILRYVSLLQTTSISILNPRTLLGTSSLSESYERTSNSFYENFLQSHPQSLMDKSSHDLSSDLWQIPYHLKEEHQDEFWREYQKMCIQFYVQNLNQLTKEELLTGLKECHEGCEEGFREEDFHLLLKNKQDVK